MNETNVEALRNVLIAVLSSKPYSGQFATEIAEEMSAHGVLAPWALTDEQIDGLNRYFPPEHEDTWQPNPEYDRIRAELKEIAAKDET